MLVLEKFSMLEQFDWQILALKFREKLKVEDIQGLNRERAHQGQAETDQVHLKKANPNQIQ